MGNIFGKRKRKPPPNPPYIPPSLIEEIVEPPFSPLMIREPVRITRDNQNTNPIGMSYWNNINNHSGQEILKLFLSIDDELIIFTLDKRNLNVISERKLGIHHTGEGCYFSATQSSMLYVPIENTLFRVNIDNGSREWAWVVGDKKLWQVHTSYDDKVHSATLRDNNYNNVAWITSPSNIIDFKGSPDECQIDKSNEWLFIKEDKYNRIIRLSTNAERIIEDSNGALGHSDCGYGCAYGEDDWFQGLAVIDFLSGATKRLYHTGNNMGYISSQNNKLLLTTPTELKLIGTEGDSQLICSNLTEDQKYENRPKANLCPLGEYAIWTAFVSGRRDAFIVKL